MNQDKPSPTTETTPGDSTPAQTPAATGTEGVAGSTPEGFEEFDLDDIEVVESKVFA